MGITRAEVPVQASKFKLMELILLDQLAVLVSFSSGGSRNFERGVHARRKILRSRPLPGARNGCYGIYSTCMVVQLS